VLSSITNPFGASPVIKGYLNPEASGFFEEYASQQDGKINLTHEPTDNIDCRDK
jgi:hypothetical protein